MSVPSLDGPMVVRVRFADHDHQVIIGQEYVRMPGDVDRFFPLLLGIFIMAEVVVVLAWQLAPPRHPLRPCSNGSRP